MRGGHWSSRQFGGSVPSSTPGSLGKALATSALAWERLLLPALCLAGCDDPRGPSERRDELFSLPSTCGGGRSGDSEVARDLPKTQS